MKNTFSISEALSFGWNTFRSSWKFWVVASILVGAARMGTGTSFSGPANSGDGLVNDFKQKSGVVDTELMESDIIETEMDMMDELNPDLFGTMSERVLGESDKKVSPLFVGIGIVYGVVFFIFMMIFAILAVLANIALKMGYMNLRLDAARGNELSYKTLLNQVSLNKAIRLATAQFLAGLITLVGFILLIIPGFYFMFKYMFVSYAIVDEDLKIGESLKRSSQLTKGVKFKLFLFSLVFAGMFILGVLAFGVGAYIVGLVAGLAIAHIYTQLADDKPQQDQQLQQTQPALEQTN